MTDPLESVTQGVDTRPPRIVLLGREKVGKSTFASQAPSPIFLPIVREEGLDAIDTAKFPTASSFDEVLKNLRVLREEGHEFQTVVIDSISALEPLVWEAVCAKNRWRSIESPGYGKGYVEALTWWRQILEALDYLRQEKGMAAILIGHTRIRTINSPLTDPYEAFVADIHDRAANAVYRWTDSILFADRKMFTKKIDTGFGKSTTHAVGTDESVLFTRARPGHPGGGRGVYGNCPYELPLIWDAFQSAIDNVTKGEKSNG